jgi:hypothetical protein
MKQDNDSILGNAMAGHSFRASNHPKQKEYDNPLTDFMNFMIAQCRAKQSIALGEEE